MPGTDDWYERRLVEETGKLRVEAAAAETRLVERIATAEGALRHDMAAMEVRLVKWSFVFWVGQVAAMAAILSAVLR